MLAEAEVAPESFRVGAQVENVRAGVAPESFLVGVQVENVRAKVAPELFLVGAQVGNVVCRYCACTVPCWSPGWKWGRLCFTGIVGARH